MNRNNLPLLLMLATGLITCIISVIRHFDVFNMLLAFFICLLISYVLGSIIKEMLNYFDHQNEQRSMEAGEVIEKEAEGNGEEQSKAAEKPEGTVKSE